MPDSALEGIRVIDLTRHIAGPYCTKLLADYGAEVVKIEQPAVGDPCRSMGPFPQDEPHPERSLLFAYLNTNKQSVTLDLKSEDGRHIFRELLTKSDLVVENFHPRVMPSLGLGYEELRTISPRLVMVSISNFGQTGPYRDYKATDIVEYALGGMMYIFGSNHREPLKHALHQAQFKAGTNAATAATIAIYRQQLTDRGEWVDISIQESMAAALRDTASMYSYMGAVRWRRPEHTGDIPRQPVETSDGHVVPISHGGAHWEATADLLEEPRLLEQRFSTPEGRSENARELDKVLRETFSTRSKFETFHAANKRRGLIYGVVHTPKDVLESPQYRARHYFVEIDHPVMGTATYPGAQFVMGETPWGIRSPAPTLGQHNRDVLCDRLGYSQEDLARFKAQGVI